MSYNLYLEMKVSDDIDLRVQNVENFYYWYSSILLPYNRVFLKEKWNSLGMTRIGCLFLCFLARGVTKCNMNRMHNYNTCYLCIS